MQQAPTVVDTAQVAAMYGVHVRTVHRWAETGRIPYLMKLNGKRGAYLFDLADVKRAHSP